MLPFILLAILTLKSNLALAKDESKDLSKFKDEKIVPDILDDVPKQLLGVKYKDFGKLQIGKQNDCILGPNSCFQYPRFISRVEIGFQGPEALVEGEGRPKTFLFRIRIETTS